MAKKIIPFLQSLFLRNWQQKCTAILCAIVIWFMVNKSITITKTFPNVPIKIINLPQDKTIEDLLPTGFLHNGITLTLKGTKNVLEHLESNDLEVLLNLSGKGDEWIGDITKKNLVSLNPEIDLRNHIDSVIHPEFIIKLSKLVTEKIPITVTHPLGEPPQGYLFLDIWPQIFYHTVSGPENLVKDLKKKGIELALDLDDISKTELDHLTNTFPDDDEIYFFIPNNWKKITIPFQQKEPLEINDPNAYNLHITFLRNEFLSIEQTIPINLFFPLKHSPTVNPETCFLKPNQYVKKKNGLHTLNLLLYAGNVSRYFLDLVKDRIEIVVIASSKAKQSPLKWSVQIINPMELENRYIKKLLPAHTDSIDLHPELHEQRLRERFREYVRKFTLHTEDLLPLKLNNNIEGNTITVEAG